MQDVRVIGVEQGALVLATDAGAEYRLAVTSSLPAQVRQADPDQAPVRRASPKDIQARVRSGSSAEQVAELMDVDIEYVRRFEGPVLAERAFVLDSARRVAVSTPDADAPLTFGEVIDGRLESGGASAIRWSSFKHVENGWQVQVDYTADEVEHDARWRFDPKTSVLAPDNAGAHRLSHEDDDEGLTPRLRAVEVGPDDHDSSRFDSGAFHVTPPDDGLLNPEVVDRQGTDRPQQLRSALPRIGAAPVEERAPGNETADLLEALRRRRGERESATFEERRTVTVVDVPLDDLGLDEQQDQDDAGDAGDTAEAPRFGGRATGPQLTFGAPRSVPSPRSVSSPGSPASPPESADDGARPERRKRARRSMPSWDEIVFGTKSDDDLA